jgi:uncharacterized membrane protein
VNGTPETLPSPSGTTNAEATAITVSGSDVYVAGYAYNNNSGSNGPAVYWANGTLETLPLPSGTTQAEANAIAVSGNNVYVAGYAFNTNNNPQENGPAAYWMNGTLEPLSLPSGMTSAEANAIAVSGSSVYVAGFAYSNSTESAAYWVNGTHEILPAPSGTTGAVANAIAVSTQ